MHRVRIDGIDASGASCGPALGICGWVARRVWRRHGEAADKMQRDLASVSLARVVPAAPTPPPITKS